jgi:hypothetical protein
MITRAFEQSKGRYNGFGKALQANVAPLALIGVGVVWLLANNTELAKRDRVQDGRPKVLAHDSGTAGDARAEREAGRGAQIFGANGEPATRERGGSDGWVHQAAGAARGAISSVRDAGSSVLDRAGKYTQHAGDAKDRARQAGEQLAQKIGRDPWLIGVVGLIGAAMIAVLLPPTRRERELMGEAGDKFWDKAAELGHETVSCVRNLVQPAARNSGYLAPEA